jgi:FMN phosphatase YigB (HAD superfamily)
MAVAQPLAFLLDVDNTLLDNDAAKTAIAAEVEHLLGSDEAARFWRVYEDVRAEEGFVDFPATVARVSGGNQAVARQLTRLLYDFPFERYLYPHALEAIAYLNTLGETVVLSDGDQTFQLHKIRESGIAAAVKNRVLIVVHKEDELDRVFAAYPARHYVAVDDKPRIVSALERACPTTFTTILVEQGKYAAEGLSRPLPDIIVPTIGDLREISEEEFLRPHVTSTSAR